MKNNEKQKLDDIIKNQATIEDKIDVNIKSGIQNTNQIRNMLNIQCSDSG
jgi:ribosomal protein S13